jgi:diaminopimelate epimerase
LEHEGSHYPYSFVNSGVPHAVIEVDDLGETDVKRLGAAFRCHADFAPAGTNANFVCVDGPQELSVRTYERGVEGETLACGTGVVASALIAGRLGWAKPPVHVRVASGDILEIDYRLTDDGAADVTLQGPAVHVFQGVLTYPAR